MKRLIAFALLGSIGSLGCVTPVGSKFLGPDTAQTCRQQCSEIGLQLESVVVMPGNAGCVCRAEGQHADASGGAGGGMAAILLEIAAAQQKKK